MNVFFIKKIKQKIYQLTKKTIKELVIIRSRREAARRDILQ